MEGTDGQGTAHAVVEMPLTMDPNVLSKTSYGELEESWETESLFSFTKTSGAFTPAHMEGKLRAHTWVVCSHKPGNTVSNEMCYRVTQ